MVRDAPDEAYSPAFMERLQERGVFGGMRAGLLTEGALQPRSAWWAHKLYADGVTTRVAASVTISARANHTPGPRPSGNRRTPAARSPSHNTPTCRPAAE